MSGKDWMTGRINTDAIPPGMLFSGWNMLAHRTGWASHELKAIKERFRAAKDYERADEIREIHAALDAAMNYLGLTYTPDEEGQ